MTRRELISPPPDLRDFKNAHGLAEQNCFPTGRIGFSDEFLGTLGWLTTDKSKGTFSCDIPSPEDLLGSKGNLTVTRVGLDRFEIFHNSTVTPTGNAESRDGLYGVVRSHLIIDRDAAELIGGSVTTYYRGVTPQVAPISLANGNIVQIQQDINLVAAGLV